jgi:hypothetical protein
LTKIDYGGRKETHNDGRDIESISGSEINYEVDLRVLSEAKNRRKQSSLLGF